MAIIKSSTKNKCTPTSKQNVSTDPADHKSNPVKKYTIITISFFLTIALCFIYLQVIDYQFINFDDEQYVTENIHVISGLNLNNIEWAFTSTYASNWHPLTWISHMMDVYLFGINPGIHHVINVIYHILNSVLLFIVLNKITGAVWRSAAVAALFAFHPLHVESVAWISERKDVLSTFFWILTIYMYLRYVLSHTVSKYLLMIVSFSLGLMAKPMLVTLPFVLVLLDFWPLKRRELSPADKGSQSESSKIYMQGPLKLVLEKIPLIILSLTASGITFYAQSAGGAVNSLELVSFSSRFQNAIISYVAYLLKMVWPFNLAVFYPYPQQFNTLMVVICLLLIIAVTVIVVMYKKRLPYLLTGWFWYLGTLVPVIGIVKVGSQSMADRYTYIPLIGIFIMIVWSINVFFDKFKIKKQILVVLAGSVFLFLIVCSWIQLTYWENDYTLFTHAIKVDPNNYVAHENLGTYLFNRGDVVGAKEHSQMAFRINPHEILAYCNFGKCLFVEKKYDEAYEQFNICLKLNPQYQEALKFMGNIMLIKGNFDEAITLYTESLRFKHDQPEVYNHLGQSFFFSNRFTEAIKCYQEALRLQPLNIEVMNNLDKAMSARARFLDQILSMEESIKINANNPELHAKLADMYSKDDNDIRAITHYQRALSIQPTSIHALFGLTMIYSKNKKYHNALNLLIKLNEIQPDNPEIYYNIACIYAKLNMNDKSIKWLEQAVRKGFNNWELIMRDPDLASIRNTAFMNKGHFE